MPQYTSFWTRVEARCPLKHISILPCTWRDRRRRVWIGQHTPCGTGRGRCGTAPWARRPARRGSGCCRAAAPAGWRRRRFRRRRWRCHCNRQGVGQGSGGGGGCFNVQKLPPMQFLQQRRIAASSEFENQGLKYAHQYNKKVKLTHTQHHYTFKISKMAQHVQPYNHLKAVKSYSFAQNWSLQYCFKCFIHNHFLVLFKVEHSLDYKSILFLMVLIFLIFNYLCVKLQRIFITGWDCLKKYPFIRWNLY